MINQQPSNMWIAEVCFASVFVGSNAAPWCYVNLFGCSTDFPRPETQGIPNTQWRPGSKWPCSWDPQTLLSNYINAYFQNKVSTHQFFPFPAEVLCSQSHAPSWYGSGCSTSSNDIFFNRKQRACKDHCAKIGWSSAIKKQTQVHHLSFATTAFSGLVRSGTPW